ncbi:hypothetical protein Q7P37_003649 [Cladosporium fusiforme]
MWLADRKRPLYMQSLGEIQKALLKTANVKRMLGCEELLLPADAIGVCMNTSSEQGKCGAHARKLDSHVDTSGIEASMSICRRPNAREDPQDDTKGSLRVLAVVAAEVTHSKRGVGRFTRIKASAFVASSCVEYLFATHRTVAPSGQRTRQCDVGSRGWRDRISATAAVSLSPESHPSGCEATAGSAAHECRILEPCRQQSQRLGGESAAQATRPLQTAASHHEIVHEVAIDMFRSWRPQGTDVVVLAFAASQRVRRRAYK